MATAGLRRRDVFTSVMSPTERSPAECYSAIPPGVNIEFDGTTVLCRVCGDKASGFHYGVHSCEGCKGFFRRSIQQKIQYRPCTKNQQCSILRVNRNRCQYCRLKKCIAVGMSRDAVRFGRVPKREKAKILAAMQSVNAKSQEKAISLELEDESKLVATIINAHVETCDYTRDKITPFLQRAREDPVYAHATSQSACPLHPAVQIENENQKDMEDISQRFSPTISGVIDFAKRIPGFFLLAHDDQVTLLKAGVFEVLLIRLACMFDSRTNTMVCLNGQVLKRESLQHTSNVRFLTDSMFDFADRLNMLQLSETELALFCAVVVIAADRPGIRNVELVEKIQGKILQALQNSTAHTQPQNPNRYQELMKKIPDLRTLNTLHAEKLCAFKMPPTAEAQATSNYASSNMHQLYQTQVSHYNAYGMGGQKSPNLTGISNEDSKGSWGDQDTYMSSPNPHRLMGRDSHQLVHGCTDLSAWSPSNDSNKNQDIYGSNTRSSDDASYKIEETIVNSPSSSNASTNSSSMRHLSSKSGDHHLHHEGGNCSGDELATSPNGKCPFKGRKLDSPTDSGIDSGKELGPGSGSSGSQSRSTSICSSPRSSMDEKVKDISDCELSVKQESIEDMPVLKRALQAPPLINTNLLMDEAYKPHKKFRALRKDSDSGAETASSPSSVASSGSNCHSPMNISMSLASTHSTLVKTLSQGPQMSEQQLKRTDIIHNIIMRSEQTTRSANSNLPTFNSSSAMNQSSQLQQQQECGTVLYSTSMSTSSSNPSSPSPPFSSMSPMSGKSLMSCSPGYYIPQPGNTTHGNGYPTSAANPTSQWSSSFGTRTTSPIRHSYATATTVSSSPAPNSGQAMPLGVVSSSHHQHFSSNLIQHSQNSQVANGSATSPLPRMYYNPSATSSSPILATTPQSPTSVAGAVIKQAVGNNSTHMGGNSLQISVKSPTSPLAGQIMIEQQQHYQPPQTVSNDRNSSMDSQPLNLSKKLCSPLRLHNHHSHISASPHIHLLSSSDHSVTPCPSQRVKMEVV